MKSRIARADAAIEEAQKRVAQRCLRFRFEGILRFRGAALSESHETERRLERGGIIFSRYAERLVAERF